MPGGGEPPSAAPTAEARRQYKSRRREGRRRRRRRRRSPRREGQGRQEEAGREAARRGPGGRGARGDGGAAGEGVGVPAHAAPPRADRARDARDGVGARDAQGQAAPRAQGAAPRIGDPRRRRRHPRPRRPADKPKERTRASATMPPAVAKVVEAQRAALGVADGVSLAQYAGVRSWRAAALSTRGEPARGAALPRGSSSRGSDVGGEEAMAIAPDRCTLPQAVEVHATRAASCGADAADAFARARARHLVRRRAARTRRRRRPRRSPRRRRRD